MKSFNMVAGLPRSGSSLLVNILNSNPGFHATSTSGVVDVMREMKYIFSHNHTWKTKDRLSLVDRYKEGMKGFLEGFYREQEVVFDKCRGWTNNMGLIDEVLGHQDSKVIWVYRNVADVMGSIEKYHQKHKILANTDEAGNSGKFMTLDKRVGNFINEGGIINYPVEVLKDAYEMGFGSRILLITYEDLTNEPERVLSEIHDFIGEKKYDYDFNNIKQTVDEDDAFHNYKFPHKIKEGKIEYVESKNILPAKYIDIINRRYSPLEKLVYEGDLNGFLNTTI